jgi:Serine dehydrogenase proteinase
MPTWGGILQELKASASKGQPPAFDAIRRKYLIALSQYTGRAVILYSTKFAAPGHQISPELLSINDEDLQGLMEVTYGLLGNKNLDFIIHSPGGSLDAAEAIVSYLRSIFDHIRVVVPNLAMSAATMISCAGDRIVMGKHSFLGPIDPQFILTTAVGPRTVSAEAIMEQFEMAQKECQDPAKLGAWIPMLSQYGPDVLVKCQHACTMSKSLVQGWLEHYMFKGDSGAKRKADKIAKWLAKHRHFKSHGRHIPRTDLENKGLLIDRLEDDPKLEDLVLSIFHATNHTFNGSGVVKIIENHDGRAFVKSANLPLQIQGIPQMFQPIIPLPQPAPQPPALPPQGT